MSGNEMTCSQTMMPLAKFVAEKGRNAAALDLGCTPAALTKAIGAARQIFVEVDSRGQVKATELSRFPGR